MSGADPYIIGDPLETGHEVGGISYQQIILLLHQLAFLIIAVAGGLISRKGIHDIHHISHQSCIGILRIQGREPGIGQRISHGQLILLRQIPGDQNAVGGLGQLVQIMIPVLFAQAVLQLRRLAEFLCIDTHKGSVFLSLGAQLHLDVIIPDHLCY